MDEELLEQSQVDSKEEEFSYETEDELIEHIKSLANQNSETDVVEDEVSVDEVVSDETINEDKEEPKVDEQFDLSKFIAEFELPHAVKIKDRGLEIEVKKLSELVQLGSAGLNYTNKSTELAPLRKIADYAKQHNIGIDDLEVLADIRNGNKDALASMAKKYGVDVYDIDTEADYKPSADVKHVEVSYADEVAMEMQQSPEVFEAVRGTLATVPRNVAEQIVSDGNLLSAFRDDISTGIAQQVIPEAVKRASIYGGDFIQHYVNIANELSQPQQEAPQQQVVVNNTAAKAKASVSSTSAGIQSDGGLDVWDSKLSPDDLVERIRQQANLMRG
jgi:hypothetical protein